MAIGDVNVCGFDISKVMVYVMMCFRLRLHLLVMLSEVWLKVR